MPNIILLTDFGDTDAYAGIMKGVVRSIAPEAGIIDLTHKVAPQNIGQAAYLLWSAHCHFPDNSVFVCVVDPGVGTNRRILALQGTTASGKTVGIVAPHNGLADLAASELDVTAAVWVENRAHWLPETSGTFHGRDIFAPVGAHLAKGASIHDLGPDAAYAPPPDAFATAAAGEKTTGKIIHIDHFGNLISNIKLPAAPGAATSASARVAGHTIAQCAPSYAWASEGELLALRSSNGLLEIAVRNGSAASRLGVGPGVPVEYFC